MEYQGIIFDFNGTLFFDNDKHVKAWNEISKILRGKEITLEELHTKLNGTPNIQNILYFTDGKATKEELEKYLEDECYSFVEINIGKHHAHEGIVIEKNGDAYEFGYSERGNKRILMSFSSEQELVEYALEKLKADKWNKAHLVAWVWSEAEIQQAEAELKNYNISFERNDVPNY